MSILRRIEYWIHACWHVQSEPFWIISILILMHPVGTFLFFPYHGQDRQPLCDLPGDLRKDQSLQSQIEEACQSLNDAKEGKEVQSNLLKAWLHMGISQKVGVHSYVEAFPNCAYGPSRSIVVWPSSMIGVGYLCQRPLKLNLYRREFLSPTTVF